MVQDHEELTEDSEAWVSNRYLLLEESSELDKTFKTFLLSLYSNAGGQII
jgi:hypothetical protein